MSDLVAERLAKADEDYSVAAGLLRRKTVPAGRVCFHCQQGAEKYLKALLQARGLRFGRTHDLESLARLLGPDPPVLALMSDHLKLLSDYAVKYRYPGFSATVPQARGAMAALRAVRALVRRCLGS